jgi:hypothetical protein
MVQVAECLPSKRKALSSNSSTARKEKETPPFYQRKETKPNYKQVKEGSDFKPIY